MPRVKPKIGDVIKAARLRNKMTAEDVAAACNVSRSRIYQWESQTYVFAKNLPVLAEVLHIPVRRLEQANGSRV